MHYGAEHTFGARVSDAWTYRGLKTVVLENDHLRVVILADKGADVASLVHKPTDTEFLFRTPWGVRNPALAVASTGDGVGVWMDHYEGGWQTVLPNAGNPATSGGAELGLHAEANLVPWDVQILEEGPERAAVRLRARLVRSPLVVAKELELTQGSSTLVVREEVANVGAQSFDLSYGQHIAFGPPFLSGDCVVDLPGGTVVTEATAFHPRNRLQAGASTSWPTAVRSDGSPVDLRPVPPPSEGSNDLAYILDMPAGWYALTNRSTGVGVAVRYPVELFRYLWYWQMFGGGLDYPWWGQTYNIGLEPFTSYPNHGLDAQLRNGTAWRLDAGARHTAEIRVTAFVSHAGVADVDEQGRVTARA